MTTPIQPTVPQSLLPKDLASASKTYSLGEIILDQFQIFGVREGGFGRVYLVVNVQNQREFAIKTLKPMFSLSREVVEQFKAEAEFWINLEQHPNIVQALFVGLLDDVPYLLLEYVHDGGRTSLRDWLQAGRLETQQALNFGYQLCSAMEFLNQKSEIAHLDLKPENILVDSTGVLKVSDFGAASVVKVIGGQYPTIDIGTWPYSAPELFVHEGRFSSQCDIYSFGIILYEMLTGKLPYPFQLAEDSAEQYKQFSSFHKAFGANKLSGMLRYSDLSANDVLSGCISHFNRFRRFADVKQMLKSYMTSIPTDASHTQKSVDQWYRQALSMQNLGRYSEALSIYNYLLSLRPSSVELRYFSALCLVEVGQSQEAQRFIEWALRINPSYEPAQQLLQLLKSDNLT